MMCETMERVYLSAKWNKNCKKKPNKNKQKNPNMIIIWSLTSAPKPELAGSTLFLNEGIVKKEILTFS